MGEAMSAFHQMGNDTINLVLEPQLQNFRGVIISPVNYRPGEVAEHITKRQTATFPFVLDPQLYYPRTERLNLHLWPYFPAELDTSDLTSEQWWSGVALKILESAQAIGAPVACSPAGCASSYPNAYYTLTTAVANEMAKAAKKIDVWQTVLVSMADVEDPARAYAIASIVSGTKAAGLYLVFLSDLKPRLEYTETEQLKGALVLTRELARSGLPVTVGFTGTEAMLWHHAGAANCATGKNFNLRRFTRGRFDEPNDGGRQHAYWFEESLLALLRAPDLVRVRARGLLSETSQSNPYGQDILETLDTAPGTAWLAQGWRQYMHWFADILDRMDDGFDIDPMMKAAEKNWEDLEDQKPPLLMDETHNDGRWIRPWRRALSEYGAI
jgi:hypothetical protein